MKTTKCLGIHNISANTTNSRFSRTTLARNAPLFVYESNDLLNCLMPITSKKSEDGGDSKVVPLLLGLSAKSLSPFLSLL